VQKRLNRSRCRLAADSSGYKEPCIRYGVTYRRHLANTTRQSVLGDDVGYSCRHKSYLLTLSWRPQLLGTHRTRRGQCSNLSLSSFHPERCAEYSDKYVCLFVCLSVRSRNSKTARSNFSKFPCMLPMAVAVSSSDGGVAMRYILPILLMTSCFQLTIGQNQAQRYVQKKSASSSENHSVWLSLSECGTGGRWRSLSSTIDFLQQRGRSEDQSFSRLRRATSRVCRDVDDVLVVEIVRRRVARPAWRAQDRFLSEIKVRFRAS